MIRQISGVFLGEEAGGVLVDVSGWGALVRMSTPATFVLGQKVTIFTYLVVKQDGFDLYGFESKEDRAFFELILLVPGIGPKTALSLLQKASRESLERAISIRDLSYLTRVVGLGKKSAEKILVELSEKVTPSTDSPKGDDAEVFDTLVALGYTEREARKALANIPLSIEGRDARLKAALGAK
ncbi:MAG: Holliday junction branch migration protein RuvA [Candidatus Pacebacteria bacterium]|nr:Holliday junction branch migration protein RuvA [Candidatus Paceibacterota bacterium]